mmetsp:Transcript_4497/g.6610  ORF Transcript_4497/g.6610 Transcript_4497/m.6610 type:complete len:216 (-) Transcript_4497:151-798(-)
MPMDVFFSQIRLYFSFLVFAFNPCHGSFPFKKYSRIYPMDSKSSLLDCSIPKWLFMDAYLAVPVKCLSSLYLMWLCLESLYFLDNPKSTTYTICDFLLMPIKKLSGFISRCIKFFECIYSTLLISWSASMRVVCKENFLPQSVKSTSNDGPSKSMTIKLYPCSVPVYLTLGIPNALLDKLNAFINFASLNTCGNLHAFFSSFIASCSPFCTFIII